MARLGVVAAVASGAVTWAGFALGAGLFVVPLAALTVVSVSAAALAADYRPLFADLLHADARAGDFSWRREMWPLQWRMALSWLASYFSMRTFNLFLFDFEGAEAAARFGMSWSLALQLSTTTLAWINTRIRRWRRTSPGATGRPRPALLAPWPSRPP